MSDVTSLRDKYALREGRAFLTGTQALARLPLVQRWRDEAAGLRTAGLVSGYRGSPLGSVDQELWRAARELEAAHVRFQPGVNEDLAVTAIWGSQQVNLFDGARYDGVFGMWYGKGPGVDRSADALRHANAAGTARLGGVLAVAGDDHACKSSTLPHQTEPVFAAVGIPVLAPADVQDLLDFGVHGWAMSRYSGCWTALKCVSDVVETSASVELAFDRVTVVMPGDLLLPPAGVSIRYPDPPLEQERRLLTVKLPAVQAYARANGLDRKVWDPAAARIGLIAPGKSWLDLRQALAMLGIDEAEAGRRGIRLRKVGLVWPLEPEGALAFARGLEEVLVVEEKRGIVEDQLRTLLYASPERTRVLGKTDETGAPLLPAFGELSPDAIALAIGARLLRTAPDAALAERVAQIAERRDRLAGAPPAAVRPPHYCSGCPHNISTKVPEGSRATAGIGCHGMATFIYPETKLFCQMGGEGLHWVGQQPFTETRHVFANMGEGTYFHSGLLAIRAAVAANTPITYKILYNDAVAMTGGQPVDGPISVPRITQQLAAEGVGRIVVVTDEPERYESVTDLAPGVPVRHRREMDATQRELRELPGVTAIVYDQTCAAEKRRRRKRGRDPDPARRVVINTAVCEACGDCSAKSNCISVVPVATDLGTKRAIDQSSCNKDFSCIEGFCPSFVTVEGGRLRKGKGTGAAADLPPLADPLLPSLHHHHAILVTGIGGTGVVTIGALLGMAAHLEGRAVSVLDMAGLAQKGGSVWSHIKIGAAGAELGAARIAAGEATALIGADLVVAASAETLGKLGPGTHALVNSHRAITGDEVRGYARESKAGELDEATAPTPPLPALAARIRDVAGEAEFLDATAVATALAGDAIATNLFLLGLAYQKGLVPLARASILRAVELNGTAVQSNIAAFEWGRRMAADPDGVERLALPDLTPAPAPTLVDLVEHRAALLTEYQDAAYADRYRRFVAEAARRETEVAGAPGALAEAVARFHYKLLAYKDEYEVARLHADPAFRAKINAMFEGDYSLRFHLAAPVLAGASGADGEPRKRAFGGWMLKVFEALRHGKRLRGSWADPFARQEDRRVERQLVADYETRVIDLLARVTPANLAAAAEIAAVPDRIRGYGPVKQRHLARARAHEAELLARFERDCALPVEPVAARDGEREAVREGSTPIG